MKGVVLAGGGSTRLYPSTLAVSKQLLPIYDKPMVYYPLSVLMLAGIKDILLISTPSDLLIFQKVLGDGRQWGIRLTYKIQPRHNGIAEAFIIGEEFIAGDKVALVLGDNIFYGSRFSPLLHQAIAKEGRASIFAYQVRDPQRYGIVEFDNTGKIVSLEEKPTNPKSNYAITGLYFYDDKVVEYAKTLKLSPRGELEITDLNALYLQNNNLDVEFLGRGFAWLDTGTPQSLLKASQYVSVVEENQGIKIACLEEVAYRMGFLDKETILFNIKNYKGDYYNYIRNVLR